MTVKTYIDGDGYLRLTHDDRYQLIDSPPSYHDVALLMDAWDIGLACRMIVLGYNSNVAYTIEYGLKECPSGTTGNDRAHATITVVSRFEQLARAAISIGIISDPAPPKTWIAWAQTKGYSTKHLSPHAQIAGLERALKECTHDGISENYREQLAGFKELAFLIEPEELTLRKIDSVNNAPENQHTVNEERATPEAEWIAKARSIASEYVKRHKTQDLYPSLKDVSNAVEKALREQGVMGVNQRPISAAYIQRNALQGEWWRNNKP